MEFLILGSIAVRNASGEVALGGNKPRAVLAVLLLNSNQPVSAERLALALWGEDAPGGAVKTVQVHVSRLRKALGDPDVLTTTPAGYSLRVREGELDAERFEGLVEDARQAMADGEAETAAGVLREALGLWRGTALAELASEPFAAQEIARLQEQRLAALELRVEADLAAGRHAEVVGELHQLVVDNPLREQLAAQLMLALYRCGRQTEALEAYAAARRTLVEEMGIEPGPELRERHQAILRQDPALQPQRTDVELPAALDPTTAQPLVGRDEELGWLVERWALARNGGGGRLVALAGPRGAGKTRLAAELARTIHRPGVTILHASGDGPADSTLVALRRAREATRPTLLVVDDADRAGAGVLAELARLSPQLSGVPVLVVAGAEDAATLASLRPSGVLELGPIDAEAVREIAARYAPDRPSGEVPAEWLLEASAGVPRRVHEAASQWARREAARHVGAVAERAETGRAQLRSLESELAGGIADLQERRTRIDPSRREATPIVCPFKGLATFDVADARYFFGREQLVAELVARLVGAPLLAVVGPSGSGKSSVMRAGLLPALGTGVLPGSDTWRQLVIRPGRRPLRELAVALADLDGDGRAVLAIDQFEETFTACDDEAERREFISELVHAANDPRSRFRVVLALRADYYGRCAAYPELAALLAENNVLVGAMQADELRRAIEGPCSRAGLKIEPELVDALVADVEGEPGGLPLLSAALLELWQHRDGRRLRHGAYERSGGVHGAVARLAEDAFAQLDEARQVVGRSVLMRLVGTGDDDAVERRRVALDELGIARDEDAARVVALLTDRRLLTVGAGSVELAHEALLREWPRLRGWVDEDREGLRIQRGLRIAAAEWERLRRDPGSLYRGTRLGEALEWRDSHEPALTELERAFLDAGAAVGRRERATRRRRLALVLSALSIGLVAAIAAAVYADRQRANAESRELATSSASVIDADPGRAFVLAREAIERARTPEAQSAFRQATLEQRAVAVVQAHKKATYAIDASPDGSMVVSGGADGKVRLWRTRGLRPLRTLRTHGDYANAVSFTPDGASVASASADGTVALTPTDGGPSRTLHTFAGGKELPHRIDAARGAVAVGMTDGTVWLVPTAEHAQAHRLGRHTKPGKIAVAISPDGTTVFSAGDPGEGFLWNAKGGAPTPVAIGEDVNNVTFSPDGHRVATAGMEGHVRVFDAATGAAIADIELGDHIVRSVRFSSDNRRLLTTGDDHVVRITDIASREHIDEISGVTSEQVLYAGDSIVGAGAGGTLEAWAPLEVKTPRTPAATSFTYPSFSRDGRRVASGDYEGPAHVWDLGGRERTLPGAPGVLSLAAMSVDGSQVVSAEGAGRGTVRLYDVKAGETRVLSFPSFPKYAIAMSATRRIAVAGDKLAGGYPIVIQGADGSNPIRLTGHTDYVDTLAFDEDGTHLVSGSWDGTARIWDLRTRKSRTIDADPKMVRGAAFSPDGKRVVTAGDDGTIRVWPVDGGDPVVLVGHKGSVNTASFNRHGDRIVSTGMDGTVRIWDAAGGDTLVVLVRHRGADGGGAAFSYDGRYVVSSGGDGMRVTRCEVCGSFDAVERLARTRAGAG